MGKVLNRILIAQDVEYLRCISTARVGKVGPPHVCERSCSRIYPICNMVGIVFNIYYLGIGAITK